MPDYRNPDQTIVGKLPIGHASKNRRLSGLANWVCPAVFAGEVLHDDSNVDPVHDREG